MQHPTACRILALGAFAVVGATSMFLVGAHAGARLNGHINSTSVARIPLRELRAPAPPIAPQPPPPPPEPVAHK